MNEYLKLPAQFVAAGKNVSLEKQALFEMLMSAMLLGMETAERNLTAAQLPAERPSA